MSVPSRMFWRKWRWASTPRSGTPRFGLVAGSVLLLAIVLRFSGLGATSLDIAEIAWFPPVPFDPAAKEESREPRFYGIFLDELWGRTLSETVVRLPSALLGSASLLVLFLVLRTRNPAAAVASMAVLALLPVHLRASRIVDPASGLFLIASAAWGLGLLVARLQSASAQLGAILTSLALFGVALWASLAACWLWPAIGVAIWVEQRRFRFWWAALWWIGGAGLLLARFWLGAAPQKTFWPVPVDVWNLLTWWNSTNWVPGLVGWMVAGVGFVVALRDGAWRWLVVAVLATLATLIASRVQWLAWNLAFSLLLALPATLLLGLGLAKLLEAASGRLAERPWFAWAGLALIGIALVPGAWEEVRLTRPNWRVVARMLVELREPGDLLVPIAARPALAFYEPELALWAEQDVPLGKGVVPIGPARAGWIVVGPAARLHPEFKQVMRRAEQLWAIDVSPDPSVLVYRYDRRGQNLALRRLAYQMLPTAVVARPTVLLDLLRASGFAPPALWKVDQVLLDRGGDVLPSPLWLEVIAELVKHGNVDRGASLAVLLARRFPDWPEAQQLRERFVPARNGNDTVFN